MINNQKHRSLYEHKIQDRSFIRYLLGLIIRWKKNLRFTLARYIARRNGATIGEGVIMPISLARKMNANAKIGNHTSIQTDKLDFRSPLTVGNHVVIGGGDGNNNNLTQY